MTIRHGRPSATRAALAAGLALATQCLAPAAAAPRAPETNQPAASISAAVASERYGALQMRFEPNVGQFDERVEFVAQGGGYKLSLAAGEAVFSVRREAPAPDLSQRRRGAKAQRPEVVRTRLVGASTRSSGEGVGELAGVTNYFRGNDPSRWRTGIVSYGAVRYTEVYSGIDVVYYGNGGDVEYDFIVAPGADPAAIRMQVEGAERLRVDASGDLVMELAGGGELRQRAPAIYQEGAAGRERVAGGYVVRGDVVTFEVGAYDPTRPLVVDPVIAYSNVLALGYDYSASSVAVGADGSAYVSGSFRADGGGIDYDAFVAKLAPSGGALVYVTYLGGGVADSSFGIALGADGSVYVTGYTESTNFPTAAPLQASLAGPRDVFVTKLSASGSTLVYSTYLGGSGGEYGRKIALGADGSAYVTGTTESSDFPTAAPFQARLAGPRDAFVTKLSPSGSALTYSTYLGGNGDDYAYGVALGADGSAYVTGSTGSSNFPIASPLQGTRSGPSDAFVTKLSASGAWLAFSTYLGGSSFEDGYAIAVGADGSAYVAGHTSSINFPTTAPMQASPAGNGDAFVTKLSASGTSRVYSTYLGGSGYDAGTGIAVGSDGNAYVTGYTESTNFPTVAPVQASLVGPTDSFVTRLNASGRSPVYSTYLGTDFNTEDFFTAVAVDADGSAYVAYNLIGDDFAYYDAVVAKITPGTSTTAGVYDPATGAWFLRNANTAGAANLVFTYGAGGTAVPLTGDWNGDGRDTPGLYFPSTGAFFLKNVNAPGAADLVFTFGAAGGGFVPLAGDWDGDGDDTVGLYDPASGAFFLRNANAPGPADLVFTFGAGGLVPIAGDWNGDGSTTVGLYDPSTGGFFLKNANAGGAADLVFTFGAGGQGYVPLAGDWDGDGRDTVGLAAPSTGTFLLRLANAPGAADLVFAYGPGGATPLAGDWDGV